MSPPRNRINPVNSKAHNYNPQNLLPNPQIQPKITLHCHSNHRCKTPIKPIMKSQLLRAHDSLFHYMNHPNLPSYLESMLAIKAVESKRRIDLERERERISEMVFTVWPLSLSFAVWSFPPPFSLSSNKARLSILLFGCHNHLLESTRWFSSSGHLVVVHGCLVIWLLIY